MTRTLGLALLGAMMVTAPALNAQGFTRTDVTNNGTHLVLNGLVSVTDSMETDFEVVDIDLDGDIDVIVGRKTPFTTGQTGLPNLLLINDGAGHLTDMSATLSTFNTNIDIAREVKCGDLNNDGWPDVVTFNTEDQATFIYYNLGNDLAGNWLGLGAPSFVQFGVDFSMCGGEILDYDVDGWMDLFRVDYQSAHENDLLRQNPAAPGTFIDMTATILSAPNGAQCINTGFGTRAQAWDATTGAMLDVNLDGFVDLCTAESGGSQITFSDGAGGWIACQDTTSSSVYDAVHADFDNDGRIDLLNVTDGLDDWRRNLSTNANGTVAYSGTEAIGFGSVSSGFGANPHVSDFDGDGDLDVFVTPIDVDIPNCSTRRLILYENKGPGVTPRFQEYLQGGANPMPQGIYDLRTADFDGDGILDIIMTGCTTDPGFKYWVSDPNAMPNAFASDFIPQANGSKIFKVDNVPTNPGAARLYNFFDLDASAPLGTGPFFGLSTSVLNQVGFGYPFVADLAPAQASFQFTISAFAVQAIPVVRQRTAYVNFTTGQVELAPLIEETSN
ncbi:MAG: VCBS repeat-containing protein [Planctomycetota bacterium]